MAIIACPTCKPHSYQDEVYGVGKRVHNPRKHVSGTDQKYRCTVCEAERGKHDFKLAKADKKGKGKK